MAEVTLNHMSLARIKSESHEYTVRNSDFDLDANNSLPKEAVQTGEGTFVDKIGSGNTEEIVIYAELDDTAEPGSYDIGVAINPLSTDG